MHLFCFLEWKLIFPLSLDIIFLDPAPRLLAQFLTMPKRTGVRNTPISLNGVGDHPSRQKSGMDVMLCLDGLSCVPALTTRDTVTSPMLIRP